MWRRKNMGKAEILTYKILRLSGFFKNLKNVSPPYKKLALFMFFFDWKEKLTYFTRGQFFGRGNFLEFKVRLLLLLLPWGLIQRKLNSSLSMKNFHFKTKSTLSRWLKLLNQSQCQKLNEIHVSYVDLPSRNAPLRRRHSSINGCTLTSMLPRRFPSLGGTYKSVSKDHKLNNKDIVVQHASERNFFLNVSEGEGLRAVESSDAACALAFYMNEFRRETWMICRYALRNPEGSRTPPYCPPFSVVHDGNYYHSS